MHGNYMRRDSYLFPSNEIPYSVSSAVPDEGLTFWAYSHSYQLFDKIGEGAFGKVFKALHIKSNTIVAFKFISKLDELKSLQEEVEIQKKLHHPNIVKMIESFGNENGIALVMEYVPRSLKEIIETEGVLSEERTQLIISHLVSALYYLHHNSILHRDLKPPNVLVDYNDVAKLCDFGLARFMLTGTEELTQASLKGTPLYMAPEVINSPVIPPTYNHNADLWSLGCIAYHLLCGRPPFDTKCLMHLVLMMKEQPIIWPDTVSPACLDFLEQLLQKNPLERLTWPGLLEHKFVKDQVFILDPLEDYVPAELNDVTLPLNSMKIIEEEDEETETTNSSSEHELTSIENTTEEDLRSSQSSWCSETCQELDVSSNQTNSTGNNAKFCTYDFVDEELNAFIQQSASEVVAGNFTSISQKSFLLLILSCLKNVGVCSKLLNHVVNLLTMPFATPNIEQTEKDSIIQNYLESKVITCLMQSFSTAFKTPPRINVSPVPPNDTSKQELDSLESVLLFVEGLSLDKPLECLQQFIDSIINFKIVPLLQRCLLLCHGSMKLVTNTLAVLILILIYLPHYEHLVQDVIIGKYLEDRIPNVELHKLLRNNEDASVRERTCVLILHMTRLNANVFEDVWHQTLTNDIEFLKDDPCSNVAQASICASEVLKQTHFYIVETEE